MIPRSWKGGTLQRTSECIYESCFRVYCFIENENNILPLSKSIKKVAVIGPNAAEVDNLICRYGPANAPIKQYIKV